MIGTILGIVFQDEDSRVLPVGAVRYVVYHLADNKIVLRYHCPRGLRSGSCAYGMIARQ
jgi:hypothetical protein